MELRHLRYFVAIAEAGSLMKASERLHVAQPALSVHLSNIEVEFGTKLVVRSNRGVELTEDGVLLYDRAVILLQSHQELLNALKGRKNKPTGTVSLGLPSTTPAMFVPELYRILREELPEVNLYIADASTAALYEWLLEGKLDLALLFSLPSDGALDIHPLYVEDFCLVGRRDENTPSSATIDFDEIFDLPLIVPSRSTSWRKILEDAAERRGKTLLSPIETESFSALRAVALSGQCHAILPRRAVLEDVESGRLQARRIVNPGLLGAMSLVNLNSRALNRAAREVRDVVVRVGKMFSAAPDIEAQSADAHTLRVKPSPLFPPPMALRRAPVRPELV